MWRNIRFTAVLAACVLGLTSGTPVRADEGTDEAEERAYARDQLLRRARESVDPSNPAAGGLDHLKSAIEAKRAIYAEVAPAQLDLADRMLGKGDAQGLIQLGAQLYRWIAEDAAGKVRAYLWDPDDRSRIRWVVATDEGKWLTQVPAADGADKPEWVDLQSFLGDHLEWNLYAQLPTKSAVNGGIDGIAALGSGGEQIKFALTHQWELTFWICRPWLLVFEQVVDARVKTFDADQPPR